MANAFDKISCKNKEKLLKLLETKVYSFPKNFSISDRFKGENFIGIIESGSIIFKKNDINGDVVNIEELYEGDIFSSNINLPTRNIDILTSDEAQVIIIDYDYIISKLDTDKLYFNQFIKNLFVILNDKIKEKNERIEILKQKSIRSKLLKYFDIEYTKHKSKNIYLPFNFKDLADYLAVDRSALSREMSYLKEEGFISTKGKRISLDFKGITYLE